MKLTKHDPQLVVKNWGGEIVVANCPEYCGKILKLESGRKFSMHAHRNKLETFYVLSGRLILKYINTDNAQEGSMVLHEGDAVHIPRMCPHQLVAIENSAVAEFSTFHEDSDSYRYLKGDSQA